MIGRTLRRIPDSVLLGIIATVVAVPMLLLLRSCAAAGDEIARDQARALAYASSVQNAPTTPLVEFAFVGYTCADGWGSPSIGRPGACSHHGGVVGVWKDNQGNTMACGDGKHPPLRQGIQEEQRRVVGQLVCTSER